MRLLFDTNVLIHIEDPKKLTPELQELLALIRKHGHAIVIHPSSFEDISRDEDKGRKELIQSKFKGYPLVEKHALTSDFLALLHSGDTPNERVDNELLFALYKNNVDFLVTEDQGIPKKALKVSCGERVLTINDTLKYLKSLHERWTPKHNVLKTESVSHLDIKDSFFDSLREDYGPFNKWFEKICRKDRKCWHYEENGKLKALMIIKEENEAIETTVPLPKKKRLKISTLKVDMRGYKTGELFLKIAFEYCMKNNIPEVYLTHFIIENDALLALLGEFEFTEYIHSKNKNKKGEAERVYVKSFIPTKEDLKDLHALRFAKKYYPLFRDKIPKKFLVPIKPEYHNRLFPNYKREQLVLSDYQMTPFGNAIKKAYLCRAGITRIAAGDILIFYRSDDEKAVGCIGVVEDTLRSSKAEEIIRFVGKRTVYTAKEVASMASKPVLAILFRHHINLLARLNLKELSKRGIVKSAPQTIMEINNKQYGELKTGCKLNGHIAVS